MRGRRKNKLYIYITRTVGAQNTCACALWFAILHVKFDMTRSWVYTYASDARALTQSKSAPGAWRGSIYMCGCAMMTSWRVTRRGFHAVAFTRPCTRGVEEGIYIMQRQCEILISEANLTLLMSSSKWLVFVVYFFYIPLMEILKS